MGEKTEAQLRSMISDLESQISKLEEAKIYFNSASPVLGDEKDNFKTMYEDVEDCANTYRYVWQGGLRKQFDAYIADLVDVAKSDRTNVLGAFKDDWDWRKRDIKDMITTNQMYLAPLKLALAALEAGDD